MLGPLTAALLLTALDVRGVLLVDAATFVISAAVLAPLAGRATTAEGTTSSVILGRH